MGFFSWLTCDTSESISNIHSDRKVRTVYMLQPGNERHIEEPAYDGYGVFGGVAAYAWLARKNRHVLADPSVVDNGERAIHIGIGLGLSDVFVHKDTGEVWHFFADNRCIVPGNYFGGRYDEYCEELDDSPNGLIGSGVLVRKPIIEQVELKYPLKFSFNPQCKYEAHPASQDCPHQGYFYDMFK